MINFQCNRYKVNLVNIFAGCKKLFFTITKLGYNTFKLLDKKIRALNKVMCVIVFSYNYLYMYLSMTTFLLSA